MEKLKKFEIILDNPSAVYFAGKVISGRVIIKLSMPMEIRGVEIQFSGSANVNWTETRNKSNDGNGQRIKEYSASQRYLDHQIKLKGNGRLETLPAGEHCFPFAYTLPLSAPSSFEGTHGHIRYFSKAVIDCPSQFDSVCKIPFTVNSLFDLNQETTVREPVSGQAKKTFCCLCCVPKSISLVAEIDRTGYVPGESIIINAEINNLSDKKIRYSKVILRTTITYHVAKKTIKETKDITEVEHGPIEAGQSDIWNAEPLLIPSIPPSDLTGCKIIDIEYYIVFSVVFSMPAMELKTLLPILIGTIPLQNNFVQPMRSPPNWTSNYSPSAPPMSEHPNGPPPSYDECVFGQPNIRSRQESGCTVGKLNYADVYTFR